MLWKQPKTFFKKFYLGSRNLDDQVRSSRPEIVDSEAVLQAIKANQMSSTWRLSGKLGISLSSVVCHYYDLSKNI